MASLQDRLDQAFGALGTSQQPVWRPSEKPVFRSGAQPRDEAGSSDEEYTEKQRRESVPGLAAALVEEDEPDAEGFRPSTAFCRALDAEDEYNEIDEVATGLISRRQAEALPPRDTQVLEDNIYEQRSRQRAGVDEEAAEGRELLTEAFPAPVCMEVEETPVLATAAAGPDGDQQQGTAGPGPSSLATMASGEARADKKKVRFEGVAPLYVPPIRQPGYQRRFTEMPPAWTEQPDSEDEAQGGASMVLGPHGHPQPRRQQPVQPQPRRQQGGGVPDHVRNPQRYTCYVLDVPLVVGGGVGQLAGGQQNVLQDAAPPAVPTAGAAAAAASTDAEVQPEPERWEGPVGAAGSIQFKPRQQRTVAGGGAAEQAPARKQGAQLRATYETEEGGEEAEEADVVPAAGVKAGDLAMQEAVAEAKPAAVGKRSYRSSRAAVEETE